MLVPVKCNRMEKKCNSLSAFDQREFFFFLIQVGFLKDNVIHIMFVSEFQCLVDFRENIFSLFDPTEKTHTNTSQCHKHCKTGPFLWTSQLKSGKGRL